MEENELNGQDKPQASGDVSENKTPPAPRRAPSWVIPPASQRPLITVNGIYTVAAVFSNKVFTNPEIAQSFIKSGMSLRMEYYDPENWGDVTPTITIDLSRGRMDLFFGECNVKPKVTLIMHGDTAHKFWMQKINIMAAIISGQIRPRGPLPQLLRLLPIIKKSYIYYRETLLDLGLIDLLNYPEPYDFSKHGE